MAFNTIPQTSHNAARFSMKRYNFSSGTKFIKSIIPLFLLAIFSFSVNAQSKNTVIFGDALLKDKRMEKIGTVLTVVGSITLFTGNILYWKSFNADGEPTGNKVRAYRDVMFAGAGLMTVGIPLWAIGKSRERHIRIEAELVKFKGFSSANGIGLKVHF
jgi:hypothetical protein